MSGITGGFDAVIQIAGDTLVNASRAMHQAGSVSHYAARAHNGLRHEFSFGAPLLELDTSAQTDPWLRCLARTRAVCRSQPIDDPYKPAESAVAEIVLRGRLELPLGDPSPIGPDTELTVNWIETSAADIVVHASSAAAKAAVRDALLEMITLDGKAGFAIGYLVDAGVGAVALTAVPSTGGKPAAMCVGLNLSGTTGTRSAVPNLVQQDWVVALDRDLVIDRVVEALARTLGAGALPPPHGPAPVLVDERDVCVLETPAGCLAQARQRTYLDSLVVELTAAGISFSGDVRQMTNSLISPPLSATWSTQVDLDVDAQGSLSASATEPAVQLHEWYAVVANTLSGGSLERAVSAGAGEVLAGGLGSDPTGMLGALVQQLGAAGRTTDAGLVPRATTAEVRPEGVLVHGVVDRRIPVPAPAAALHAIAAPDPGRLLFNAGSSWAPGDDAVSYDWDFGDGASASHAGTSAAFTTEHTYAKGDYTVSVTIKDSMGRSAQRSLSISPARLALRHLYDEAVSKSPWQACVSGQPGQSLELEFEVTSCGSPMPGATVTVTGQQRHRTRGITDENGRVRLKIDPKHANPPPAGTKSSFTMGSFNVSASQSGFDEAKEQLELIDCDRLNEIILATKKEFANKIDRLIGYAALRELIESGIGKQTLPPFGLPGASGGPLRFPPGPSGPELEAVGIGIGTRLLSDLTQLIELNSKVLPVHELLGLDPDAEDFSKALEQRVASLWGGLDRAAERINAQRNGPPPEGGGPPRP